MLRLPGCTGLIKWMMTGAWRYMEIALVEVVCRMADRLLRFCLIGNSTLSSNWPDVELVMMASMMDPRISIVVVA